MANPLHHAQSSVRKFDGHIDDYLAIHTWFDASKAHHAHFVHRALRHHSQGIFWAEEVFGQHITNADGKLIPTRFIGEQHVIEDMGYIPSLSDWLKAIVPQRWMGKTGKKYLKLDGEKMEMAHAIQHEETMAMHSRIATRFKEAEIT